MSDLISRQDAISALKDNVIEIGGDDFTEKGVHEDDIDAIINKLPSAQPERKRGYWINLDSDEENYDDIRCSNCGMSFTVDAYGWCDIGFTVDDLKFCPNCGARMEEGGE